MHTLYKKKIDIIKTQKETNMQFCLHIGCCCNMLGLVIGLILLEPTQQMLLLLELRTPKTYHHVTELGVVIFTTRNSWFLKRNMANTKKIATSVQINGIIYN